MRKYFNGPKRVADLLAICCALGHDSVFVNHVVNDGRSFDMATYDALCQQVDSNQLRPSNYQQF